MSESVDILIKADDQATAVVNTAAKSLDTFDGNLKKIKESGQQAKKSTDFFRVLANSLGGTEIGKYVGQLGEAAEKTSQFAEVQKLGGAGALVFKAGLVGLTATIAVGIGNALGNAIFQTERWKKALADATEEGKRLDAQLAAIQARQFGSSKEDIELIADPDKKKAAYEALFRSTEKEIAGVEDRIRSARKQVEAYNASWTPSWIQGNNDAAEAKLATDRKTLEVLSAQREEVRKERIERLQANEELKQQQAEAAAKQKQSDSYVQNLREELEILRATKEQQAEILATRNAIGAVAQDEVKRLLMEKDAILEAQKAKDDPQKLGSNTQKLQGKDERLLTRGTVDPVLKVAKEQLQELKSIGDILSKEEETKPPEKPYTVVS